MGSRSKADDEQARPRVAETGHGFPPILPISIRAALPFGNLAAVRDEAWTPSAGNDLPLDPKEVILHLIANSFRAWLPTLFPTTQLPL